MKQLWSEIAHEFEDKISAERLKKRWRQLRDDYIRAKKKVQVYVPGAADVPPKPTFKYYDIMRFLDDSDESVTESQPSTSAASTPDMLSPRPQAKRKRSSSIFKETLDLQKELLKNLKGAEREPDGVDGFLILLGEGLRRLPLRERNKLRIRFLVQLEEEENKLLIDN